MNDWDGFIQRFKNTERGQAILQLLPQKILRQVLAPVLTVTEAVKNWELLPPGKKHYTLLWVAPEMPELVDKGAWFGLIPELLGRDMGISLLFLDAKAKEIRSPNPRVVEQLPDIEMEFLTTADADPGRLQAADLIVWSHPDNVTRWRETLPELPDVPMLALYWSSLDTSLERELLLNRGWDLHGTLRNNFELQNNVETGASWGRFIELFKKGDAQAPTVTERDLYDMGQLRHHSGVCGMAHPISQPGQPRQGFKVRAEQTDDRYLYVVDDLYLNLANRYLYRYSEEERSLYPIMEVAGHLLANLPTRTTNILLAYQWAAKVKLSYAFQPVEDGKKGRETNEAFEQWLSQRASEGDPNAAFALGCWREIAKSSPDEVMAVYLRAAELGHASGQYAIADILWHDVQDKAGAVKWFEAAAAQNHGLAMYNLAIMHLENMIPNASTAIGFEWAERAAKLNQVNAQALLGQQYHERASRFTKRGGEGEFNPLRDYAAAMKYFEMAADRGLVEAAAAWLDLLPVVMKDTPRKEQRALGKKMKRYKLMVRRATQAAGLGNKTN